MNRMKKESCEKLKKGKNFAVSSPECRANGRKVGADCQKGAVHPSAPLGDDSRGVFEGRAILHCLLIAGQVGVGKTSYIRQGDHEIACGHENDGPVRVREPGWVNYTRQHCKSSHDCAENGHDQNAISHDVNLRGWEKEGGVAG